MKPGAQAQMLWPHPGQPKQSSLSNTAARGDRPGEGAAADSSQCSRSAAHNPGAVSPLAAAEDAQGTLGEHSGPAPPDNFVLLLLRPAVVDHLELKSNCRHVYFLPSAAPLAEHLCLSGGVEEQPLTADAASAALQACETESDYQCLEVNA